MLIAWHAHDASRRDVLPMLETIDTAEETMSKEEKRRHEAEVEELREWQATRNRGRVAEMLAIRKRYRGEIEEYLEGE